MLNNYRLYLCSDWSSCFVSREGPPCAACSCAAHPHSPRRSCPLDYVQRPAILRAVALRHQITGSLFLNATTAGLVQHHGSIEAALSSCSRQDASHSTRVCAVHTKMGRTAGTSGRLVTGTKTALS